MNVKLKICGMRDLANIAAVSALHPDYMGFIFYNGSPRFVGESFVLSELPASIKKVGVFVNETTERMLSIAKEYSLDFIQLHGNESAEQCVELSRKVSLIKAFSIDGDFDFKNINPFKESASYFLFDTKGKYYGGNAKTFDWTLLEKYDQQIPFFLSGGISAENVQNLELIKNLNIHAIDVNSGAEVAPGLKDVSKIKKLKSDLNEL